MTQTDRYLAREIGAAFAMGFALFLLALVAAQLVKISDLGSLFGAAAPANSLAQMVAYALPPLIGILLPMSWLFACLFGLSRLGEERELLALAQLGASPWALYRVPVVGGILVACFAAVALIFGEPWGATGLRRQVAEAATQTLAHDLKAGRFYHWLPEFTVRFSQRHDDTLTHLFVSDRRNQARPMAIFAERGQLEKREQTSIVLALEDGFLLQAPAGEAAKVLRFRRGTLPIDLRRATQNRRLNFTFAQEKSIAELWPARGRVRCKGDEALLAITLQRKFSFPAGAIVFACVAVGLAARIQHGARAKSVCLSAAIVLGYYALGRSLELWARAGGIVPVLAAWLPNALGLLSAATLCRRVVCPWR